jgi:hypothetical protein
MSNSDEIKPGYCVLIDDNFHYMDEERRSHLAVYSNYEDALEQAKEITRKSVLRHKGASADETYENYTDFGSDPFIQAIGGAPEPKERYSAWGYADLYSKELHGETDTALSEGEAS